LTALTSAIKKVSDKNKNLMILFETFTSINTVHIMMSELDKLSCDIKYKSCIVSGTYNFRTLNDGTTPKQFATYCNRYDFIKVIGQNCCDVSTDIPYILSEYKKVSNKFIFCKPNTDAVTLDELSGYLRKFNCLYGGFCCGATSALTGGLGKKLHNFSVRSSKTNNATYAMEILPQGAIVGDRINTTKNSKLTT
jgi:methionine synthase I (cobalamin-dependent)